MVSTGSTVSVASQTTAIIWCWPEKQPAALLIVILTTLVIFKEYLLHFSYVYCCFPVSAKVGIVFFCLFVSWFVFLISEKKKYEWNLWLFMLEQDTRAYSWTLHFTLITKNWKTHNRCNTTHISLFMLNFNNLK